jgi:hypothetical protein
MSVRRLSKAARGFLVCPLPDVFDLDASSVSALQHSRNIPSPATLQPTQCLIVLPFYLPRAVATQAQATRGEPICEFLTNSVQVLLG